MADRVVYNTPSECPSKLGRWLGHGFRPIVDPKTDEGVALICNRCGLVIGPEHSDGSAAGGSMAG